MSLSLLGAYNSDSDSDNSEATETIDKTSREIVNKNPFIVNDDESDSDQSDNEEKNNKTADEKDNKAEIIANPFMSHAGVVSSSNWLPKPSFMQETEQISGLKYENSVFSNPFRAKEDKKEELLSKHVGITSKQESGRMFNGKKVCLNFRKGRCRHGHNCKFAHDNDVSKDVVESLYSVKYDETAQISNDKSETDTKPQIQLVTSDHTLDDQHETVQRKQKRPGLSDTLTPSKKAMKFHNKVYN